MPHLPYFGSSYIRTQNDITLDTTGRKPTTPLDCINAVLHKRVMVFKDNYQSKANLIHTLLGKTIPNQWQRSSKTLESKSGKEQKRRKGKLANKEPCLAKCRTIEHLTESIFAAFLMFCSSLCIFIQFETI